MLSGLFGFFGKKVGAAELRGIRVDDDGYLLAKIQGAVSVDTANVAWANTSYIANAGGTGFSQGDDIIATDWYDVSVPATPVLLGTSYLNRNTGLAVSTPDMSKLDMVAQDALTQAQLNSTFTSFVGEVQASPTANTVLDRLKTVGTSLSSLIALFPATLGQTTKSGSLSVTIASDQPFTTGRASSVTITRPANTTPYAANDVIGDTGGSAIHTFSSMSVTSGAQIEITSVELEIALTALPSGMSTFTLHLYNANPTAIADNALFDFPAGDSGKYVGSVQLVAPTLLGDSNKRLFSCNDGIKKQLGLAATTLYVQLATDFAYTPTSGEVYKLTIHAREV